MCGRYYRTLGKQQIAETLHAEATGDPLAYAPGYNIAPTTTQPVLRLARDTNLREIVPMRWGLVRFGSARIDPKRSTFNARAEGLENSSLWKRPLHRQRCLVPVSGYYEWRKADKEAFRFTVGDEPLFSLAGLWDAWKSPEGTWLQSFTIITTDPNTVAESTTVCRRFSTPKTMPPGLTATRSSALPCISFAPSSLTGCSFTALIPKSAMSKIRDRRC